MHWSVLTHAWVRSKLCKTYARYACVSGIRVLARDQANIDMEIGSLAAYKVAVHARYSCNFCGVVCDGKVIGAAVWVNYVFR